MTLFNFFFFFITKIISTDDLSICQPQTGLIIVRHIIRVSFRRIDADQKSHLWSGSLVEESMAVIFVSDASHWGEPSAGDQVADCDAQHAAVRSSRFAHCQDEYYWGEGSLFQGLFGRYRAMYQLNSEH
jgi:hypothetical protein